MNLKKFIFVVMAALVFMLLLGCEMEDGEEASNGEPANGEVAHGEEPTSITLATTSSTYDSGLLHEILPIFEEEYNIEVDVISVGTGQAIETGERGDCDIILVHARELEDQFVEEGYGTERWDVMYNDFVVLGPEGDPAGIYDSADVTEALQNIVEYAEDEGVQFLSRGDVSGTHMKEINLWELAGIDDLEKQGWYNSLGQGMGDTLVASNEMQGYVLADRGTFLSMEDNLPNLEVVFEGDDELANPYGIIPVNPDEHPGVNHEAAMLMVEFFTAEDTQEKIGEFGKDQFGQPLFFPDAD